MPLNRDFLVLAATIALSACASSSDDVVATYVSPREFADHTCEDLIEEHQTVRSQVFQLSDAQDDRASQDAAVTAAGVILFWPALFFIEGDDSQTYQLSEMKGRQQTLETVIRENDCDNPSRAPESAFEEPS